MVWLGLAISASVSVSECGGSFAKEKKATIEKERHHLSTHLFLAIWYCLIIKLCVLLFLFSKNILR